MSEARPLPARPTEPSHLVGYFQTPADLYHACEALRDEGYRKLDAHTPFPVHGLERAMGLRPTVLPWIVLICGLLGGGGALWLQWFSGGVAYPLNISGKPSFALQSSIPVTFELTVLLSAFGAFFGTWGLCGLPKLYDPIMKHPRFGRATNDLFFVSVPSNDPRFDRVRTKALLERLGAHEVTEVAP